MYHIDTSTFIKHYYPQNHTQMQQVVFSIKEDILWDHILNNINQNKDKHRPRFLNDMEKAFIESELKLQEAIYKLDYLQNNYKQNLIFKLTLVVTQA